MHANYLYCMFVLLCIAFQIDQVVLPNIGNLSIPLTYPNQCMICANLLMWCYI